MSKKSWSIIVVSTLCLIMCSACQKQALEDESSPSVISVVYPSDSTVWGEVYGEANLNQNLIPSPIRGSAMKEQRAPLKSED